MLPDLLDGAEKKVWDVQVIEDKWKRSISSTKGAGHNLWRT
jgi:hypothetical protein